MMDEAEKAAAGRLPADPKSNVIPLNAAAKRKAELEPRVLTVQDLLKGSMERAMLHGDRPGVCTCGIAPIDDAAGGICPGHCWLFGADTNWGKSSWLVMVADENLKRSKKVLIVSSEDDEDIYGDRLMARRARVNAKRLRDGKLDKDESRRVADTANRAELLPVYLDGRGRSAELIVRQVEGLIQQHSIDLVLYDYLQEFRAARRYQDERIACREVAAMLRQVVKRQKKAGVIFSQITLKDGKKYPDKHSIRESRDVSNAAEVILLGFTPTENVTDTDSGEVRVPKGTPCVLVDKVKHGPKGFTVLMDWDKESACFNAVAPDLPPEAFRDPDPHWTERD